MDRMLARTRRYSSPLALVLAAGLLAACQQPVDPPSKTAKQPPKEATPAPASPGSKPALESIGATDGVAAADTADALAATTIALPELDIPFEKFVLDNGLTVIVHEDHKTPIVAVNIWYHVASKNEPAGRTGFAHLFEHLMFQGSENHAGEFFEPFMRVGATDMNGTTNEDRTNYFENVPTPALDVALWMESDRMGHFLGAITQPLLDEQRGVVQNEKRQGLNQPYGEVWELAPDYTYPKGHPYAHSVIGSMEDLDAASLEDVKSWFQTWYGPSNAVLVLSGDITPELAREKVELYFGDIAPGPVLERPDAWPSPMSTPTRLVIKDEVPQARVYKIWNVAPYLDPDERRLELAVNVLADGKNSRLYKRLVYEDELATDVTAWLGSGEIGSQVWIYATARPGVALGQLELALDEEVQKLRTDGISEAELARAKMQFFSAKVYGAERVGGFGGKSDLLARSQVLGGTPNAWREGDRVIRDASVDAVGKTIGTWLTEGVFTLEVHPEEQFTEAMTARNAAKRSATEGEPKTPPTRKDVRATELSAKTEGADRSALPASGTPPELTLPGFQRFALSNGLHVVLAERHEVPVVRAQLTVGAGYAADQFASMGVANMTMTMMDEGTQGMDALAISGRLDDLGASIGTSSSLDTSSVTLSALTANLLPSLAVFAEIVSTPSFPADELERQRKKVLARIQQEKSKPVSTALRLLGPIMFGEGHAYGVPLTGSGTEQSVAAITRDDLVGFHRTWFRPHGATLVVVGDTTVEELKLALEGAFADWQSPPDEARTKLLQPVENPKKATFYLVNKANAEQSVIIGGLIAPPRSESDIPMKLANGVLGGLFTSRLNMNLREDKHWSYGSYSFLVGSQHQRPLALYAAVQTDKTAESLMELRKELSAIVSERPATDDELARLRDNFTLKLPGENETTKELLGNIVELVEYGLPDDYWQSYVGKVRGMPLAEVDAITKKVIQPERVVWVVVGDLTKIQAPLAALGVAEIKVLDAEPAATEAAPSDPTPAPAPAPTDAPAEPSQPTNAE